jgi:hypothetical protein
MESQSFTARRSAASNLPNFQLPPPDLSSIHKYPSYAPSTSSQSAQPISSVLTPPGGAGNDALSPLSSSVNSASSQSSANGVAPYNPTGYWPGPQQGYQFSSAPQMPSPFAPQNNMYGMGRQIYSPAMNYPGPRNVSSPATGESLPPPPYNLDLPPFPTAHGSSGGSGSLPTLAPQQQQSQQPSQQQQQQQQMNAMMNMQQPASQAPQNSAIHSPDNYGGRPPPTPTYQHYAPSSTPQQSSFPAYTQPSPTQQSPVTSGPPQSRVSPVSAQHSQSMQPPPGHYQPRYNPYPHPRPALAGPIMSNIQSPGNPMQMVGGMSMQGYPQQHMGHMYGGHPGQQQQQNDRPFKCDQCPQSFNRNHDLKRHKRIHLAVKPFPCGHCEKSFSRKDALKVRHLKL